MYLRPYYERYVNRDSKYESRIINISMRFRNLENHPLIYGRELRRSSHGSLNFSRRGSSPRSSLPGACDHPSSARGGIRFFFLERLINSLADSTRSRASVPLGRVRDSRGLMYREDLCARCRVQLGHNSAH